MNTGIFSQSGVKLKLDKLFAMAFYVSVPALFFVSNGASARFLEEFKKSSIVAMQNPIEKFMKTNTDFVTAKTGACQRDAERSFIMKSGSHFLSENLNGSSRFKNMSLEAIGRNDVEEFLEVENVEFNIFKMDQSMRAGEVIGTPWSGDYWAIRFGGAAKRYADPEFPQSSGGATWLESYNYIKSKPAAEADKDFLSPAEKYDLIVADNQFTLAESSWLEGKQYNDAYGDVERWMGLCHGWAPASFMEPRPSKTVEIPIHNSEENLKLKPNDSKALFTLKWATGANITKDYSRNATRFLGGRCNEKKAEVDKETGRILTPECFDLNPAVWHTAIVNHIFKDKRPLIIDASFDYEVWNQPVISYRFMYFNPKDYTQKTNLTDALVNVDDPEFKDKFIKFRNNPNAKKIVGVIMDITYIVENFAVNVETDGVDDDSHQTARYHYDLELDENGEIIGGEWYQNKHPDFIWMPMKNSIVLNHEDTQVRRESDIPRLAKKSSRNKSPMHAVLEKIRSQLR